MAMAQVLIRDVEDEIVEALKERAKRNQRSLQGELKLIVTQAAQATRIDPALLAKAVGRLGRAFQARSSGAAFP